MVTEYAYPVLGGISEHVHHLSLQLVRRGHDVTVVTGRAPSDRIEEAADQDRRARTEHGYRTVRLGRSAPVVTNGSIARVTVSPRVLGLVRRATAGMDVVHTQGLFGPVLPLVALATSSAPCTVGTFHTYAAGGDHWAYRLFRPGLRRLCERLDRRIAVSQVCVDSLRPHVGGEWDVIPNGIDTVSFHPLAPGATPASGPPRLLFVGRFDERNGLHTLLDAAALLQDRGLDFAVDVVGDGPARPRYEAQARRLGIWDRITWHGLLNEERPALYRRAALLAAPCTLASFGVVLLEAFASGIPIVCADNVGFRQVIRDGAPGRFVPPDDPAAFAAGLAEVLSNPTLRAAWGVDGRRIAEARYGWPQVAERIERLYLEVLTGGAAAPPAPTPVTTSSSAPPERELRIA
ncbi:MAG: glycosyltransferase family 4 protein [Actinobacteria bacterium]|nr:glycosyltransferase family 4 protein [Actinomycetota bacterium]